MIAIPIVGATRGTARSVGGPGRSALDAVDMVDLGFSAFTIGRERPEATTLVQLSDLATAGATELIAHIRPTTDDVEQMSAAGATGGVIPAETADDPVLLHELADACPGFLYLAIGLAGRQNGRSGRFRGGIDALDVIGELDPFPMAGLLVSGLELAGPRRGRDLALLEELAEATPFRLVVSTPIAGLDDLRALEHRGASGAAIRADRLPPDVDLRALAQEFCA